MKRSMKKYPLLICLIVSCALIVASILVSAFCGVRLGTSLGGGSQFEISIPNEADTKTYVQDIKNVLRSDGLTDDSFTVEDKFLADETEGTYRQRVIVVKVINTDVSDEKELKVRNDIADRLQIDVENISEIENIISSIKSNDILHVGLAIGIVVVCLFIFAWIRYDIFAGLTFLVSYIHNIILYLAIMFLTRIPLSLVSIAVILVLTIIMTAVLISIFEKNKSESEMHLEDKQTPTTRMIKSEGIAIKPYLFVLVACLLFSMLLFLIPVINVVMSILSTIIALVVSSYTSLLIGPAIYANFLEIKETNLKAVLSRNENVNKALKKKIEATRKASLKK